MQNILLTALLATLVALSSSAKDFTYTHKDQTLTYTVISEDEKTVCTKAGQYKLPGNEVSDDLVIPDSVTDGEKFYQVVEIGDYAFYGCRSLTSVTLPTSLQSIGAYAFQYCRELAAVDVPANVTSIGSGAFSYCRELTSVSIPSNVNSIGNYAFESCRALTSVYYNTETPVEADKYIFDTDTYKSATLYMPEKGVLAAGEYDPWKNFEDIKKYDFTGVEDIIADFEANHIVEVYTLSGMRVATDIEGLPAGVYIIRQGNKVKKILVR